MQRSGHTLASFPLTNGHCISTCNTWHTRDQIISKGKDRHIVINYIWKCPVQTWSFTQQYGLNLTQKPSHLLPPLRLGAGSRTSAMSALWFLTLCWLCISLDHICKPLLGYTAEWKVWKMCRNMLETISMTLNKLYNSQLLGLQCTYRILFDTLL